ncbi:MAG: sigma-70 family RNA polymerase sigma factor [Geminicoccaceae bacterium]|nr:MAG: sigma-70 family RNA polymerase sigma factor [Geminicoccaceae bacterium]
MPSWRTNAFWAARRCRPYCGRHSNGHGANSPAKPVCSRKRRVRTGHRTARAGPLRRPADAPRDTRRRSLDRFETDLVARLPQLRAFARHLATRDHHLAEDLVQEACVNALRARTQFTPGTNMDAWLFTIMRNCFRNVLKRASTRLEEGNDELDRFTHGTVPQFGHLEFMALRQAFARLSAEHREVLLLAVLGLLSYQEMADRCGCEVGTVKSRVSRAREKLRHALDGEPQAHWSARSSQPVAASAAASGG